MKKLLASAAAVAVLLARPSISIAPRPSVTVSVDWASEAGIGTSRTITTLQVVNNPVLDRHFNVNGTTFPNPIHEQVWGSLRNLSVAGLQMARFVPWYPYPRKAVAELFAPQQGKPLSWNFTLLLGQLTDFFEATADVAGADTVINFSTEPCWMFNENATQCKPPDNPDEADMTYGSISPGLVDQTGNDLAMYEPFWHYFQGSRLTEPIGLCSNVRFDGTLGAGLCSAYRLSEEWNHG